MIRPGFDDGGGGDFEVEFVAPPRDGARRLLNGPDARGRRMPYGRHPVFDHPPQVPPEEWF